MSHLKLVLAAGLFMATTTAAFAADDANSNGMIFQKMTPGATQAAPHPNMGQGMSQGHPSLPMQAAPQAGMQNNQGTVLEVLNVPSYTYLRLKTAQGEQWIAGPKAFYKEGFVVAYGAGTTMPQFHSKSLDRDFDNIVFVGQIKIVAAK